ANGIALDRANAVANALIAGGVAADRIRVVSAPIDMDADTTDPESRKADIFLDN
ncbi:MAG: hypothetical protein GVY28_06395, partial [Alphaproteobacteria bacterium]|nr:hypothetical protein [Alphaproteobacteria bacterium]